MFNSLVAENADQAEMARISNIQCFHPCGFRPIRVIRDKAFLNVSATPTLVNSARSSTAHAENCKRTAESAEGSSSVSSAPSIPLR